jgi:hypothetical protein
MKFYRFSAVALLSLCLMTLPTAALAAYSTAAVSEEDPPATCNFGDAIYAAQCYGDFCDWTRLYCAETNYQVSNRYWTTNFSEEGTNYRYCGANEIMTGISCAGSYCDNVSIECSQIPRTRYNCQWFGPHSEEQGYVEFGGKYVNGMACGGSRCDNHYYYICNY